MPEAAALGPLVLLGGPLHLPVSETDTKLVPRKHSMPFLVTRHGRPRRNFNPKKTARYGRPTFDPNVLVKYSPKWQYSRLFNFPFSGSRFRPRMRTLVVSIDGGCRVNDRSKTTNRAACAVYFGPNNADNYSGMLRKDQDQTNNRAELQAAIVALTIMRRRMAAGEVDLVRELIIKTDSSYVANCMNQWV